MFFSYRSNYKTLWPVSYWTWSCSVSIVQGVDAANIPTIHKLLFIHSSINRQNRHHRAPCVLGIFQHSQRELQANPREDAQLLLVWNGWHPYPHDHQELNEKAQHEAPQKVTIRSNTGTRTGTTITAPQGIVVFIPAVIIAILLVMLLILKL
jgi:hypothetical protein